MFNVNLRNSGNFVIVKFLNCSFALKSSLFQSTLQLPPTNKNLRMHAPTMKAYTPTSEMFTASTGWMTVLK